MARFLNKIGKFSAKRPWVVILSWIAVLGITLTTFLTFGGNLSNSFTIPGTATSKVTDELAQIMPSVSGANATAVFHTEDGSALTVSQQEQISAVLKNIAGMDGVVGVTDPFESAASRAAEEQQLTTAQAQLTAGQQQIDAASATVAANQAKLDATKAQMTAAGLPEAQIEAQLAAAQAQLTAATAQISAQQATLDTQSKQLTDSQTLLDAAANIRTVSTDGSAAIGAIAFRDSQLSLSPDLKTAVANSLKNADIDGVAVTYSDTIANSYNNLLGPGEIVGLFFAAMVLLVMLRALRPAILPIISSGLGVGVGVALTLSFSSVFDMQSLTPVLGLMLSLAIGIDYSLFILNRHRRQVLAGQDIKESIAMANATSGSAVVFAGSTVIIALLALNVIGIGFLSVMGNVAAVCVAVSVMVAVTFTPAVLGLLGTKVLGRRARATIGHEKHQAQETKPMRTGWTLVRVLVAIVALAVIAIPAASMRLTLMTAFSAAPNSTQYQTYRVVSDEFGAGMNGTLLVVANQDQAVATADQLSTKAAIVTQLMGQDDVSAVAPIGVSADGTAFIFQVVPDEGPTSESTETLVHNLRDLTPAGSSQNFGVAGTTSATMDVSEILSAALLPYLAIVVGLSFLILILVFRSILVPALASLGFILSAFAALGGTTAIYQWGWLGPVFDVTEAGPILSFAPILAVGILFGLAMDYQLFLGTGMREAYVKGLPARQAIVAGFHNGRVVVTAAAIIMGSVFAGFIYSETTMIRPIGMILALGVLFDAFVVRMVIVPGIMHLVGDAAWWFPKWLDRIMPNIDVEGQSGEKKATTKPEADA